MEPQHFESLYPPETRSEEIKRMLEFAKSGRSSQVVGVPGSGKGTLLGLLSYNKGVREIHLGENQKWFHFVYMDFSEVKKRNLFDVIKFMIISTAYSLTERDLKQEADTVNKFLKEAIGFSDELILFQALKKSIDFLAIEKELSVVFLLDRFDQYLPDVTENFFLNLKILRNRAKYRFSCVFSLKRPIEDMLEPIVFSEFHEFLAGNVVYFRLYDPVGMDFRFSYLDRITGKNTDEKTRQEIVRLTGGHGQLARLSYEIVLSSEEVPKGLQVYLFEKGVIKRALGDIWNYLTPSEQVYLKQISSSPVIARNSPLSLRGTNKTIGEAISLRDRHSRDKLGIAMTNNETEQKRNDNNVYLENVGLIIEGEIAIPLLEEYVKNVSVETAGQITYKAETNEIFKGNEEITDNLSPSEFRLLRFLIQNAGRVCEKEEVITNVWKDTKTQEGVTDQALDQIIYRLRKKIEEDPNTPVHLQTIKGRGVRFAA
ncbi:hypothetical protein C4577_01150 [Candidatus Parcubacteria bacterium]|nr:MAG: hypothetical protein C4577_01150 [Candidatus Parcubacteria bacterium]